MKVPKCDLIGKSQEYIYETRKLDTDYRRIRIKFTSITKSRDNCPH